jgi:hypothetical protein
LGASTARKKQESQYDETKPKGLKPRYHKHLRVVERGFYSSTENAADRKFKRGSFRRKVSMR